jgi:hypothetical protein
MIDTATKITQLCEAWWGTQETSGLTDQQHYAEELLALMGWDQPLPFTPRDGALALNAKPFLLHGGGSAVIAAYFVMPGTLEPPSTLLERRIDFCPATLLLVHESRLPNITYVFITDFYRSYLYDTRTDELVLYADKPDTFYKTFVPTLTLKRVQTGSLDDLRREPRSIVARQLREWIQRWTDLIMVRGQVLEDQASVIIDRLLIIRFLFYHNIFRRTKRRLEERYNELVDDVLCGEENGCGTTLINLFNDMWLDWRLDLFRSDPGVDRILKDDQLISSLLEEFSLIARHKFSIATILESFNYGDPQEKMRVRMVPDDNEDREHFMMKQSLETVDKVCVDIDVEEEGYRSIFLWFDKLVTLYDRLDAVYKAKINDDGHEVSEFDLFAWGEIDAHRPDACGDKVAHACEKGFRIYYNTNRQLRTARLMLLMHLITKYDQQQQPISSFPDINQTLILRPKTIPADRYRGMGR